MLAPRHVGKKQAPFAAIVATKGLPVASNVRMASTVLEAGKLKKRPGPHRHGAAQLHQSGTKAFDASPGNPDHARGHGVLWCQPQDHQTLGVASGLLNKEQMVPSAPWDSGSAPEYRLRVSTRTGGAWARVLHRDERALSGLPAWSSLLTPNSW